MRFATTSGKNAVHLTFLALGCVFLFACAKGPDARKGEDAQSNPADIVAEITVTRVERADISSSLTVSGTTQLLIFSSC